MGHHSRIIVYNSGDMGSAGGAIQFDYVVKEFSSGDV